jgi:hypothetical protein
VRQFRHERELVGAPRWWGRWGKQQEPRTVFRVVLQVFLENASSVDLRCALRADCRAGGVTAADYIANAPGGVFTDQAPDLGMSRKKRVRIGRA